MLSTRINSLPTPLCAEIRKSFSAYLDGAVTGHAMAHIAAHLDACNDCANEFAALRFLQRSLANLGPAAPPPNLQRQLRAAIASERERNTHLSLPGRFFNAWKASIAPALIRVSAGFSIAVILLTGLTWLFSAPISANDDNLAHLVAPHYLYSQVPPQPIAIDRDVPIMVDAKIDSQGRVYDYSIVAGPTNPGVQIQVEQNLLSSVFRPATLFGVPVRGRVVMTYMGVSVKG